MSLPPVRRIDGSHLHHESLADLEESLERGEVLLFEPSPVSMPAAEDRTFLCSGAAPATWIDPDRSTLWERKDADEARERARGIVIAHVLEAGRLLSRILPQYAKRWTCDGAGGRSAPSDEDRGDGRVLWFSTNVHPSRPLMWRTPGGPEQALELAPYASWIALVDAVGPVAAQGGLAIAARWKIA